MGCWQTQRDRVLAQGEGIGLPRIATRSRKMGKATSAGVEQAKIERLQRVPSARTPARWLTTGRDCLTKAETLTAAAFEDGVPGLVEAREVVGAFQMMVRAMVPDRLEGWLPRAGEGLVASCDRGVGQDKAAVPAAITLPWSNGQTEGQITKLMLVKRQNVWPRQDRPAASSPDRLHASMISESASESLLDADHPLNRVLSHAVTSPETSEYAFVSYSVRPIRMGYG